MRKLLLLLPVLFITFISGMAQEISSTKLDLYTKRMLNSGAFKWDAIDLFVKGVPDDVAAVTEQSGGQFKYTYGGISAVSIPLTKLEDFLSHPEIVAVQNGDVPVTLMNDTAVLINNVDDVNNGVSPLTQPYKGTGVIVGIVDDGIYFQHEDFKKPNGDTRIRFLWDMTSPDINSPAPYNYGREWNEIEINSGSCTHVERVNAFSHGTHVCGIAAGNGRALNKFAGMAPESDIVFVAFDFNRPFLSTIVDGFDYIYKKADAMGKPCVINASLGTYIGSHDGTDFAAQLIDALLGERGGRALVCSAGNAGQQKFHLGYDVTADTSFTFFQYNTSAGDIFFQLWADTADFKNVNFSFGATDPGSWSDQGHIDFLNVQDDYSAVVAAGGSLIKNFTLYNNSLFIGSVSTQLTLTDEGIYLYEAIISPQNTGLYWSFITTGSGHIDIWSSKTLMNFADMVYSGLPDSVTYPPIARYKAPDTMQTLASSYTCSDRVITVGNFVNRSYYLDVNNDTVFSPFPVGTIFVDNNPVRTSTLGSSYGPSRDGKMKPDLSAPGTYVLSSGNSRYISDAIGSGNPNNVHKIAQGGKHFRNTGTSMSSPMVAGAAALYLQRRPDATWQEVRDAFNMTAFHDTFTGPNANYAYGNGKLDAYAAMQLSLVYGCTDSTSINYDPLANMDDGSCIYPIYGCTDPLAINYDTSANADDGTCFYDSIIGINAAGRRQMRFDLFPNPNAGSFTIDWNIPDNGAQTEVLIVNVLGAEIQRRSLLESAGRYQFTGFSRGVYIYYVKSGGQVVKQDKFVVY